MENPQHTLMIQAALSELEACEPENRACGLSLSRQDMLELVELRQEALSQTGRVEFGGGVLPKLMAAFRSSAYVDRENYPRILGELQDAFYAFKNESQDIFSDGELIDWMAEIFNGVAHGSTEILSSISLEQLCRWVRNPQEAGDLEELV